jgi:hypothetical protein
MPLIVILIILLVLFGGGSHYMGPGIGYYGGGSISLTLALIVIYLILDEDGSSPSTSIRNCSCLLPTIHLGCVRIRLHGMDNGNGPTLDPDAPTRNRDGTATLPVQPLKTALILGAINSANWNVPT